MFTRNSPGRRLYFITLNSLGSVLHNFFLRLKHVNLPLLVIFLYAFVIFTRALSGAGYEESLSLYTLSGGLPTAHTNTSSYTPEGVTLPVNVNEQKAFADHWRRFKKSLRPCAQRSSSLVPKAGMPPYRRGAKKVMLNVECIRERIQSLAPSGNSLVPTIAKEERVFAMSLNTIPRRSKK